MSCRLGRRTPCPRPGLRKKTTHTGGTTVRHEVKGVVLVVGASVL